MDDDRAARNLEVLQRGLNAFVHRDVSALQSALHPAVIWHDQGRNRISGTYTGVGEVLAFLGETFALAGDSLHIEPIAALHGEEYVAAVIDLHLQRGAKSVRDQSLFLARVADDRIAEVWAYAWDPYALDEFWG